MTPIIWLLVYNFNVLKLSTFMVPCFTITDKFDCINVSMKIKMLN